MYKVSRISSRLQASCRSALRNQYSNEASVPPPKKGGVVKTLFKLNGLTVVTVGGVAGYAYYDAEFKKTLEDYIPYSREAFDYAFKYMPEAPHFPQIPYFSKTEKDEKPPESFIKSPPKKVEGKQEPKYEYPKQEINIIRSPGKKEDTTSKGVDIKSYTVPSERQEEKLPSASDIQKKIQKKEAEDAADNAAFENIVNEFMKTCDALATTAITAHDEALKTTEKHAEYLRTAMDETQIDKKEEQWQNVVKSFDIQVESTTAADRAAHLAKENLEKLKKALEDGKSNAATKKNKILTHGLEKLNKLSYELDQAIAKTRKSEASTRLMNEFRDLVEKGKKQFQKELESITPDIKLGKKGKKLTEDELNSLIAHAHRRIEQLHKQVAELQILQDQAIEKALQRQKEEDEKLTADQVRVELNRQKGDFFVEKEKWDAEARHEFEKELRQQLSRQAAAHSDHLADVMRVHRKETEVKFAEALRERLLDEKIRFQQEISEWILRLQGIEQAVKGRADLEKQGRKAQELWLACQSLHHSIRLGKDGARDPDDRIKPLANELMAIREAGDSHPFVTTIIQSVPDVAINRGVYTEEDLRDRFKHVKKICKRVARIDENGGTMVQYFLSYIQSFLIVDSVKALENNKEIDLDKVDQYTLLASAEKCLENGDLEQAIRYVNQLKGESKRVASDWLKEAILLLEAKQAAAVLVSHASASGLGSLF